MTVSIYLPATLVNNLLPPFLAQRVCRKKERQKEAPSLPNLAHTTYLPLIPPLTTLSLHPEKGSEYPLSQYRGKVVLVFNGASKCGFTPQYGDLEKLHQSLKTKYPEDFAIVGFPCNQFGGQDPGTNDQIQEFCQVNYGVTFPVLGKVDVNGDKAEPVWEWMKNEKPGLLGLKRIKWNFEKFLINREGKVVERWASTTKPETLEKAIVAEIEKGEKSKA